MQEIKVQKVQKRIRDQRCMKAQKVQVLLDDEINPKVFAISILTA